jgi:hypothetical protein
VTLPPLPLRNLFRDRPTPPCRVCNQGRSGLPGDTHADCRRQETAWRDTVAAALKQPDLVAAVEAITAAEAYARYLFETSLRGVIPEWMVDEELARWDGED